MNQDIINKIKKLLALSQSPNQAEAELASIKARELLVKHNLDMQEIEGLDTSNITDSIIKSGKIEKKWRTLLINNVANFYLCECIRARDYLGYNSYAYMIIGKKHNIEITKSIYEYLEKAIIRITQKECPRQTKQKYRENYKLGMAVNIISRLAKLKADSQKANLEERALILKEDQDVKKYISNMDITETYMELNKVTAFYNGYLAGNQVGLSGQISGESRELIK